MATIKNTYPTNAKQHAANVLKINRVNEVIKQLPSLPEVVTVNGIQFQTSIELAFALESQLDGQLNLSSRQRAILAASGTLKQGCLVDGFSGNVASDIQQIVEKLTSEEALKLAIKHAIAERTAEYKRLLELSCEDALTNLSATIASILDGEALTIGALHDTSLVLQPLDLPLERIKALALSEKYADMLRLMVDNLSAYKPQNPRIVNDCLLVDCTLTDAEVHKLADSTMYALTSKKDSPEYKGIQAAIAGIETVQGLEGQVRQLQNKLAEIEKTYIISKAITA